MRFRLQFQRTGRQSMLPMDYQYFLASWVYRVIGQADAAFSAFLHGEGYRTGNKKHKLFCLSPLDLYPYKLWKEKSLFELQGDRLSMDISFRVDQAAEHFIKGLFMSQEFYLGDRFNGVDLQVTAVEAYPRPEFTERMHYKALSPVSLSVAREHGPHAEFLRPEDERYAHYFLKNLAEKYKGLQLALAEAPDTLPEAMEWKFTLSGKPRSRLLTIKPYTPQTTKVKAYLFSFELQAPLAVQELLYFAGAGEKNAMGFGFCEVKENSTKTMRPKI